MNLKKKFNVFSQRVTEEKNTGESDSVDVNDEHSN